ncbi:MAG: peptidylprolyl isomerase, partial [Hyphomonadaceae bacterium]
MMKIITAIFSVFFLAACAAYNAPPPVADIVVLETTLGDIEIELYADKAPISAGHFLQYAEDGLYDGEGFYRVVRPETDPRGWGMALIQGGIIGLDESEDVIAHETTEMTGLSHTDGAISIARGDVGTGSAAYFFICI